MIYLTLMVAFSQGNKKKLCDHEIGLQVRVIYELLHINKRNECTDYKLS